MSDGNYEHFDIPALVVLPISSPARTKNKRSQPKLLATHNLFRSKA